MYIIYLHFVCLQTAELAAAQEKQMEVCDVCGAFLIVGDAQQRIDDHLMGKQHVGYARLKSALQEMMVGIHFLFLNELYFLNQRLKQNPFFRANVRKRVTKKSKEGKKNGSKGRERTKSLIDDEETETEIVRNVAEEWMTIKVVMIQTRTGM